MCVLTAILLGFHRALLSLILPCVRRSRLVCDMLELGDSQSSQRALYNSFSGEKAACSRCD